MNKTSSVISEDKFSLDITCDTSMIIEERKRYLIINVENPYLKEKEPISTNDNYTFNQRMKTYCIFKETHHSANKKITMLHSYQISFVHVKKFN